MIEQEARLNIVLHKNQKVINASRARFKVVKAGKRFGKTKWAIYELCKAAGKNPNGRFWYVAPSYRMAKRIAWDELNWILPQGFVKRSLENELSKELWNGAKIDLLGADNKESLRGKGINGLVMDECAYSDADVWFNIIRSQLIDSKGFAYFISTPKGRNWFTNLFEEAKRMNNLGDKEWKAWHFTIYDNPTLSKDEIDKAKQMTPDSTWEQEYMAIEQDFEGQKFCEFNFDRNVEENPEVDKFSLYRGIDWGLEHPTVCLWASVDKNNQIVYINGEYFKSGLTIRENASTINQMTGSRTAEWTVIDPSAARRDPATNRSIKDEFAKHGIVCVDGDRRGADTIGGRGVDIVKMFLKTGKVKIHPKCRNLINELQSLEWGAKTGDDCCDTLRYLLVKIHDTVFEGNLFKDIDSVEQKPILKPNEMSIYDLPSYQNRNEAQSSWIMEEVS